MSCSTCGAATQPGQKFCAECGSPTSTVTFAAPSNPPPPPPLTTSPATPPSSPATARITTPLNVVEQTVPTYQPTPNAWDPGLGGAWQVHHTGDEELVPVSGHTGELPVIDPAVAPTSSAAAVVVLAVLTAAAAVAGSTLKLFSVDTDSTAATFELADLLANVRAALIVGAIVLVIGAVLAAGSRREGVGLAGGAALGLASVAIIVVGVVLTFLQTFRDGGLGTGTFTNEAGFYVLVGAGVLGIITFLVSLGGSGFDGNVAVNPLIVAFGTVASLAVALGPLLPLNDATFGDNFSTDATNAVAVWTRIASLVVLAAGGLIGFLNRRRWGLALALGTVAAATALWLGSVRNDGSSDFPANIGIGLTNPGSLDGKPHVVTTLGLIGVLLAALTGFADDARRRGAIAMVPT